MKNILIFTTLLFALCHVAAASDSLTLELGRSNDPGMIELTFRNASKAPVELEIPVEGAGNCDKYFEIEAVTTEGETARKSFLYAPGIDPYTVKLKARGVYVHRIHPGAYLNGAELKTLQKLRVKYTNPLTGASVLSDWLVLTEM
ncbi:hypothetical protein P3T73_06995 [Kiritimatiellota bacterium B12222]|nr:hypothetical protein P3T73_06995 [Kiritimatiellota bacterium B12222]